jgi:hypothetical protein
MKTINKIFFSSILLLFIGVSCTNDDADNPTFGNQDVPIIHVDWAETMAFRIGDVINISPQISPSDGATYKWTINGAVVSTEKELHYTLTELLVDAELKFEVNRNGVLNSRVSTILVVKDYVPKPSGAKKAIAWLTKNGAIADVPWESISHLILSSVVVNDNGTFDISFADNIDIPTLLTFAHNYGVQVMIEFSGSITYLNAVHAYGSLTFYDAAVGSTQDALVANMVKLVTDYDFDGINVYMDKTDAGVYADPATLKVFYEKLGTSLKNLQNTIDGNQYDYVLSMSVYAGWTNASLSTIVNVPEYDWINVLAFAAEDLVPGAHSAAWYFTDQITQWLNWYSVAPSRIVGAVPAFGLRYFGTISDYTWGNLWEYTEYIPYRTLCNTYSNATTVNEQSVDNGLYYDGFPAIEAKAQFVVTNNLGGMALWSVDSDSRDVTKSLMKKINVSLGN